MDEIILAVIFVAILYGIYLLLKMLVMFLLAHLMIVAGVVVAALLTAVIVRYLLWKSDWYFTYEEEKPRRCPETKMSFREYSRFKKAFPDNFDRIWFGPYCHAFYIANKEAEKNEWQVYHIHFNFPSYIIWRLNLIIVEPVRERREAKAISKIEKLERHKAFLEDINKHIDKQRAHSKQTEEKER